MDFFVTSDAHWESRLSKVVNDLTDLKIRPFFETRDYGAGLSGISVIFVCQDPGLNLKRRIKFSRKDKILYLDIMLDLNMMKTASPDERKQIVAQHLFDEVPAVLTQNKIPDFDRDSFVTDLRAWIDGIGWR